MIAVDSHRDAIAAAFGFARAEYPAVWTIVGPTGTGKTILIHQIVSEVSARARRRVTVTSARELTGAMVDAIRSNTFNQLMCRFGRSDFLAIEDVGELRDRPATLEELGRLVSMWSGVMETFAGPSERSGS